VPKLDLGFRILPAKKSIAAVKVRQPKTLRNAPQFSNLGIPGVDNGFDLGFGAFSSDLFLRIKGFQPSQKLINVL